MHRHMLVLAALSFAATAGATGFYNSPTSLQQCLGIGFGPGYHAPLVLGLPFVAPNASQPIRWTGARKPMASSGYDFAAPSAFAEPAPYSMSAHAGAYYEGSQASACGCQSEMGRMAIPTGQPTLAPPMPVEETHSAPLFAAPADPYAGHEVVPQP